MMPYALNTDHILVNTAGEEKMNKYLRLKTLVPALAVTSLMSGAMPTAALAEQTGDTWQFRAEVYFWGAGMGGTTTEGDDIDIDLGDILDDLNLGYMGTFVARKNDWELFADLIYLELSHKEKATANIIGYPVEVKADIDLKNFISTLAGAYRFFETETTELSAVAGARYLAMDVDLDYDLGKLGSGKYSDSDSIWDGVVGLQGQTELNEKWYITYYGDVGAGGSDLTWQAEVSLNYRFSKVDAALGYRYLAWEFDDDDTFDDLNISGPFAGVRFRF